MAPESFLMQNFPPPSFLHSFMVWHFQNASINQRLQLVFCKILHLGTWRFQESCNHLGTAITRCPKYKSLDRANNGELLKVDFKCTYHISIGSTSTWHIISTSKTNLCPSAHVLHFPLRALLQRVTANAGQSIIILLITRLEKKFSKACSISSVFGWAASEAIASCNLWTMSVTPSKTLSFPPTATFRFANGKSEQSWNLYNDDTPE